MSLLDDTIRDQDEPELARAKVANIRVVKPDPTQIMGQTSTDSLYSDIELLEENGRPRKQADVVVDIGCKHTLFRDQGGEPYALIKLDGHTETHALNSTAYDEFLTERYLALVKKGCGRMAIADALTTLSAIARFRGETHAVWMRVAYDAGDVLIDLGTPDWHAVRVSAQGWQVEDGGAVRFRRAAKIQPLPLPEKSDFGRIWKYLNVRESDRVLISAFLLAALRPFGPYPLLMLSGEQGTGKSTFTRIIKRIIDPSNSLLRSPPKDIRDLLIGAHNSWLLSLDNLSVLPAPLSDALCRLSTGGAISERTLYSNLNEVLVEVQRPIVINGIDELAHRPDLAERGIHIELQQILDRRSESDIQSAFKADASAIFAGLLDGLVLAMRNVDSTKIEQLPRMADFALWAEAGLPALGFKPGEFTKAYRLNLNAGLCLGLDSNPVGSALLRFMDSRTDWAGTSTELLNQLARYKDKAHHQASTWPRSPRALHSLLNRLAPALRAAAIRVERTRDSQARWITLYKCPVDASSAS